MAKDDDDEIPEESEEIYEDEGREEMIENEEISAEEEGFMKGYEEDESPTECARCHKLLGRNFVESEIDNETLRFCSEKCAAAYK